MADSTVSQLKDETSAWCTRAEQFADRAGDNVATLAVDIFAALAIVREGIFLRRRWDRIDWRAPQRRRLLALLAAAQNVCHQRLAERVSERLPGRADAAAEPQRVDHMVRRLIEDDRYLAELLDDHTLPAETIAFAVECFRDDLHWLGTLVALLDGSRGIDFTGRVLLEQESLQRMIQSWEDAESSAEPSADSPQTVSDALRHSAERLRATALARQTEALLSQPEPEDWQGWHDAWQAGSRLAMRPEGATGPATEQAVRAFRSKAVQHWAECLGRLPLEQRAVALRKVTDDLADVANETLTFLEDLPLAEAVRSLEILAEDAATCVKTTQQVGGSQLRSLRRRLRRQSKAIAAELQERRLGWRLERLFGHRAVAALERLILLLLLLFVVMLAVEGPLARYEQAHRPGSTIVEATCAWIDLGICLVFLTEFSLKLFLARPRKLYFTRNWITGLLPAIPVGFMAYMFHPERLNLEMAGEYFVLLRGLRYLRLPQMARWLRFARPVLRAMRLVAFTMQASDRLVRRVAPLLNRNLVLFERAAIEVQQPQYRATLAVLRERFRYRASEVLAELPPSAYQKLAQARIEDLTAMLSAPQVGMVMPSTELKPSSSREIPLERLIARLLAATPAGISDRIGRTLAQSVARWCRAFDVFAVRRLPVVRDLVAAGRRRSPYGTTAEVANRIGALLKRLLDRLYWVADLYGTVTAPQLVDSVGDWMIKRTARPARRLITIGLAFFLVSYLTGLLPIPEIITGSLRELFAGPLVVLGLLCLAPLLVGLWFRQIAGEASDFCSRVAEAQFITATKALKRRFAKPHHAILHRRVIAPEWERLGRADATSTRPRSQAQPARDSDATQRAVELLFEDYLDSAPFHQSDVKTTSQLLGNLTLVSLRETRLRYSRRRRKQLRRLDLAGTRVSLRGPYLWFHFIARSLAQHSAKLVMDYNAHALPLERAATADDAEVCRYVGWLSKRLGIPADRLDLAAEFRRRWDRLAAETGRTAAADEKRRRRSFQGNDFTAIHFLSANPQEEADVEQRYGALVAGLMRRDRRDNVRRVFRTYPFHHWPKTQRTFNPLAIHARYLAGGRVLLLPLRMVGWAAVLAWRAARLLWVFICDVLNPSVDDLCALREGDPFAVAVRKIHRMRKPVFLECLRMRAQFDPEYLGILLPGSTAYGRRATAAPIEEDLALIDADPGVHQEFRRLAAKRRREILEFRRLLPRLECGQLSGESLRAMAIAYAIDFRRVRSRLEATATLTRAFDEALDPAHAPAGALRRRWSLRVLWRRLRHVGRVNRLFERPPFADYGAEDRKRCFALICQRPDPLLHALRRLTHNSPPPSALRLSPDPLADARRVLAAVARDPATWSRQLVILRAVQTLSVLDLKTYCDLVAELGEYETGPSEAM